MKIFCKFCGASIDTNVHSVCPNCGASLIDDKQVQDYQNYKNNIEYEEEQIRIQKQREDLEQERLQTERLQSRVRAEKSANNVARATRIGCLIPVIIGVLAIISVIVLTILGSSGFTLDTTEPTETVYVEPHHEAKFNEIVTTKEFTVVLDEWDYYTPNSYAIRDGEKYIKFHFTYTNITDHEIYDDNQIHCYDEDGRACDKCYSLSNEDKNEELRMQTVMQGKSCSGWVYYVIPENVQNVTVTYGENVEFLVDLSS